MILGAVHRSPSICLTAEENPKKPQLGDRLMKELCDQSLPQMGSLSSKWSVGSHSTTERRRNGAHYYFEVLYAYDYASTSMMSNT